MCSMSSSSTHNNCCYAKMRASCHAVEIKKDPKEYDLKAHLQTKFHLTLTIWSTEVQIKKNGISWIGELNRTSFQCRLPLTCLTVDTFTRLSFSRPETALTGTLHSSINSKIWQSAKQTSEMNLLRINPEGQSVMRIIPFLSAQTTNVF